VESSVSVIYGSGIADLDNSGLSLRLRQDIAISLHRHRKVFQRGYSCYHFQPSRSHTEGCRLLHQSFSADAILIRGNRRDSSPCSATHFDEHCSLGMPRTIVIPEYK
jgi:hypothetical protein